MDSKKKIALISHDIHNGPAMVRLHTPLKYLKDKYDFTLMSLGDVTQANVQYMDAVILSHPSGEDFAKLVHQCRFFLNIPVIVDIDDLLDELPKDHPNVESYTMPAIDAILIHANRVVVSTPYLQSVYSKINKNTVVIENTIDHNRHLSLINGQTLHKPPREGFTVGWTGSKTHLPDLYATGFVEGLDDFLSKYSDAKAYFHMICPDVLRRKHGAAKVAFEPRGSTTLNWASFCANFPADICAVPLQECPFNDAKSDLRLLDMAPFDVPILASGRADFYRHHAKGIMLYAQDTPEGWFEALEFCYHHRDTLKGVSDMAKRYVFDRRTSKQSSERWEIVLKGLFRSDPGSLE